MNTTPPTACPAWRKLEAHAETWRAARLAELSASDPSRARTMVAEAPAAVDGVHRPAAPGADGGRGDGTGHARLGGRVDRLHS